MSKESSRFNLILHGILGISPTQTGFEISVPFDEQPGGQDHKGLWGFPEFSVPIPSAPGTTQPFAIYIPGYEHTSTPKSPSPDQFIKFAALPRVDSNVRAVISVPTPDVVRGYRFAEFPPLSPSTQLPYPPSTVPLVIVMSWVNAGFGVEIKDFPIRIGGVPDLALRKGEKAKAPGWFYNLCIYFQSEKGHLHPRPDLFDPMFKGLRSDCISTTNEPDGPPDVCSPETGLRPAHLRGLSELHLMKALGSSDSCGPQFVG